jgi:transposase
MRTKGTAEQLLERRRRAIALLAGPGRTVAGVARELGVHRNTVAAWAALHAAGGDAALAVRPTPGRPRALTDARARRVVAWVLKGPKACGFETDLWTLPRVARVIEERLGVACDVDHLSRLMRGWGLSWPRPLPRALERDDAAVERWLARDWPRIKKKSAGSARG